MVEISWLFHHSPLILGFVWCCRVCRTLKLRNETVVIADVSMMRQTITCLKRIGVINADFYPIDHLTEKNQIKDWFLLWESVGFTSTHYCQIVMIPLPPLTLLVQQWHSEKRIMCSCLIPHQSRWLFNCVPFRIPLLHFLHFASYIILHVDL